MPTIKELKADAKSRGLKKYSALPKSALIKLINLDNEGKAPIENMTVRRKKELKTIPPPIPQVVKKKRPKPPKTLPPPIPQVVEEEKVKKVVKVKKVKTEKVKTVKKVKKVKTEKVKDKIDKLIRKTGDRFAVSTKPLQEHQKDFVSNFINGDKEIKGAIAIHGVGTGKTLTAVIAGEMFLEKNPNSKVYVITPASLLAGFKKELYEYDPAIAEDLRYKFYTYDGYSNSVKRGDDSADCTDSMLIIDEAQNLRTKITKTETPYLDDNNKIAIRESVTSGKKVLNILEGCALKAKRILLLSATPLVNSFDDIANLMAIINGHEPLEFGKLDAIFSNPELTQRYFGCRLSFFKNSPSDSAKFFPKMTEKLVPLVMKGDILEEYKDAASDTSIQNVSFFNGLRRAANIAGGDHSPKTNFIIDWIKGVIAKKPNPRIELTKKLIDSHTDKTVIFTHFKNSGTDGIVRRLKKAKIKFGLINGSVSKKKRGELVQDYVDGKIKVILISKAGAEGLNLLETGYIFLVEPSWNNTEREQVKGRGVRFKSHTNLPKSKRNVLVLSLFLILPKEAKRFKEITDTGFYASGSKQVRASIDAYLFYRANIKQKEIDIALNKLQKVDSVENCTHPKEFLDITNIFNMSLTHKVDSKTFGGYEKSFFNTDWKVKLSKSQKNKEQNEFSTQQLKKQMTQITRSVFGSSKGLIKQQQAFFTPPSIAHDMISFSGLGMAEFPVKILEPSAGVGMLIFDGLLETKDAYFDSVENLDPLRKFLTRFPRTDVLPQNNFMDVAIPPENDKYRVILMNPPFNLKKGLGLPDRPTHDVDFVMRAWEMLAPNAILVCLISTKYTFRGLDKKKNKTVDRKVFEPFRKLLRNNYNEILRYKSGFSGKEAVIKGMKTPVEMHMIKIFKMPLYYKNKVVENISRSFGSPWWNFPKKLKDYPDDSLIKADGHNLKMDFMKISDEGNADYKAEINENYQNHLHSIEVDRRNMRKKNK